MTKQTILVLGATGNIGFPLIQNLSQDPEIQIIAGLRDVPKEKARFAAYPTVMVRYFDFLDPASFTPCLTGVDKVFFVRPPQLAEPQKDMYPFLEYLKTCGIKQVVFVSLIGVDKNPVTPHHKIEKKILELDLPYTFIRPSFFMQNLNTTHQYDIQKEHDLFIPAGNAKTSFIDTRDIGAVAAACLTSPDYLGQKLEITGAEALTYQEISQIMTEVLGTPIRYSKPGLLKFRRTMLKRGTPKEFVNVMVMLYLITQLGNAKAVTDTLPKILGRPATSFRQFVIDHREDFL